MWYLERDADDVCVDAALEEAEEPVGDGPATAEGPESPSVTGQATLTDVLASAPGEGA